MNTDIIIPAAYYDEVAAQDLNALPQEQEIRHKGKGKQYVILSNDPKLALFVGVARAEYNDNGSLAAKSLLLSLKKQGYPIGIDISVGSAKPVTRKVAAKATGRDYNRELVVTITPRGDLILRPAGRRQSEQVALSDVYAWAQRNRCLRIAREKAAERKAKRKK